MTNPRGKVFISYRRSRSSEISELVQAMHDRGVPTWRDINDLSYEPTEDAIRAELNSDDVSGAILWLTPDIEESHIIKEVEVRLILERYRRNDGFWVIPVAAGGLDYSEIGGLFEGAIGSDDLAVWNTIKMLDDPAINAEIVNVAQRALEYRIKAIDAFLAKATPIEVVVHARGTAVFGPEADLLVDWTNRFSDLFADESSWQTIKQAISDVSQTVKRMAPNRQVIASGTPAISAGIVIGSSFPTRDQCLITWRQRQPQGAEDSLWAVSDSNDFLLAESSGWTAISSARDTAATALAVLINVVDNAETAFAQSHEILPAWRGVLTIQRSREVDLRSKPLTSEEAASLAWYIIDNIRKERHKYGKIETVHLFIAGPVGLAILLGSVLATLPSVITYEYDPKSSRYIEATTVQA